MQHFHLDGRSNMATGTDTGMATSVAPMFTDFTYNNLGLRRNVILPWYGEDTPDQFGFTGNPLGPGFTDEGVGLFLNGYYGAPPNLTWGQFLPFFEGKFQTSTTRDVGKVPYPGFVKAYMHNGYLLSLKGSSPLLRHARCLPSAGALWKLPRGNDRESELLAYAGRPEQHKHDHRASRLIFG
jgi:cytochrome c peroxidase